MQKFKHAAIDAQYELLEDKAIHIAGRYHGLLSEVSDPSILEGMIKRKSQLVALKKNTASGGKTTAVAEAKEVK